MKRFVLIAAAFMLLGCGGDESDCDQWRQVRIINVDGSSEHQWVCMDNQRDGLSRGGSDNDAIDNIIRQR